MDYILLRRLAAAVTLVIPLGALIFGAAELIEFLIEPGIGFIPFHNMHQRRQSLRQTHRPAFCGLTLLNEALVEHSALVTALTGTGELLPCGIHDIALHRAGPAGAAAIRRVLGKQGAVHPALLQSRIEIGVTTFSGMLLATVFGIFMVPGLYSLFASMRNWTVARVSGEKMP